MSASPTPHPAPLFSWPTRHRATAGGRLGIALALSALAHVASFYLFQIVYPTAVSHFPARVQATFLPLHGRTDPIATWIANADPAGTFRRRMELEPESLTSARLQYQPSFANRTPNVHPAGPPPAPVDPPRVNPLGAVQPETHPAAPAPASRHKPPPAPARPSVILLSAPLSRAIAPSIPITAPSPPPAPSTTLRPARFLVGFLRPAVPPLLFLVQSSGNDRADSLAGERLRQLRLPPDPPPPQEPAGLWGEATVHWGSAPQTESQGDPPPTRP